MIKINNLTKKYGKKTAINHINLMIGSGESIAFLGANGSGKTTLIEMIAGISKPTSGEVIIENNNDSNEIGIQFQEGNWPKGVTPRIVLKFYAKTKDDYIEEYIKIFEIDKFYDTDLNRLSGGQKQRFNAFLAVVNKAKIIILDELITGLDLKMQIRLIDFFKKYKEENDATLIVVSHMPEEVELMCDRAIILENGNIIEDFNVKEESKRNGTLRKRMEKYYVEFDKNN